MATKKKNAKKSPPKPHVKIKKAGRAAKKKAPKKAPPKKRGAPKKRLSAKSGRKSVAKAVKSSSAAKAFPPAKEKRQPNSRGKREIVDTVGFQPEDVGPRSAGQSGDLQGISNVESADSESVDELLEEGNAFEATIIKGIQDAPDPDEAEVTTHEIPEDDVPGEYEDEERPGRR